MKDVKKLIKRHYNRLTKKQQKTAFVEMMQLLYHYGHLNFESTSGFNIPTWKESGRIVGYKVGEEESIIK